jgi:hypothetical protein
MNKNAMDLENFKATHSASDISSSHPVFDTRKPILLLLHFYYFFWTALHYWRLELI